LSHSAGLHGLYGRTMRFFVIGANGKTGTQLIELALANGHHVTAFVRSPHKITRRAPHLSVVRGDPHNADELASALPGHDSVFSALGIRAREIFRPITLLQECMASTVAAMTRADVKRIVLVSAATLFPEKGLFFAFFRRMLAHQIRDLEATEAILRATPLEWTIARPPRLTTSDESSFRSARDALPRNGHSMSYRALGGFMLEVAEQHSHVREIVGLAR
jgi:putative NADH-flavin reductase